MAAKKSGRKAAKKGAKKSARKARVGRNPQTGDPIKIPAKTVVKFYVGKAVKDAIAPAKKAK